jgi:hypothetical protein
LAEKSLGGDSMRSNLYGHHAPLCVALKERCYFDNTLLDVSGLFGCKEEYWMYFKLNYVLGPPRKANLESCVHFCMPRVIKEIVCM